MQTLGGLEYKLVPDWILPSLRSLDFKSKIAPGNGAGVGDR